MKSPSNRTGFFFYQAQAAAVPSVRRFLRRGEVFKQDRFPLQGRATELWKPGFPATSVKEEASYLNRRPSITPVDVPDSFSKSDLIGDIGHKGLEGPFVLFKVLRPCEIDRHVSAISVLQNDVLDE